VSEARAGGDPRSGDKSDCHSLWIGADLPPTAQACLRSFLRHGHRVILHSYRPLASLPHGVERRDAAEVLPQRAIVRHHRSGSVSLFSNYFRYKLAERVRGFWIDCDVYCVRPFDFAWDTVFGWEDETQINGAVLRLVPGSPLQRDLVALFETPTARFPWFSPSQRLRARLRSLYYRKPQIALLPWGAAGPRALTWLVAKHGLHDQAQPTDVFYPVGYDGAANLRRAAFDVASATTERTVAVHLWNQLLTVEGKPAEPGSFLARLAAEAESGQPALDLTG